MALLVLLLWAAAAAAAAAAGGVGAGEPGGGQCAPGRPLLSAAVRGLRNSTGHWRVTAGVEQAAGAAAGERALGAEVSLSCGAAGALGLYLTVTVSETPPPPPGYRSVNGLRWFKPALAPATWTEARDACLAEGAHLIVVNSEAEAEVVRTLAERSLAPHCDRATHRDHYFVGFNDRAENGRYLTVLGDPLAEAGYLRWATGEPSDSASEGCGASSGEAAFRDVPCSWRLCYICERP